MRSGAVYFVGRQEIRGWGGASGGCGGGLPGYLGCCGEGEGGLVAAVKAGQGGRDGVGDGYVPSRSSQGETTPPVCLRHWVHWHVCRWRLEGEV